MSIKVDLERLSDRSNITIRGFSEGEAILAKGILFILEKLDEIQKNGDVV